MTEIHEDSFDLNNVHRDLNLAVAHSNIDHFSSLGGLFDPMVRLKASAFSLTSFFSLADRVRLLSRPAPLERCSSVSFFFSVTSAPYL